MEKILARITNSARKIFQQPSHRMERKNGVETPHRNKLIKESQLVKLIVLVDSISNFCFTFLLLIDILSWEAKLSRVSTYGKLNLVNSLIDILNFSCLSSSIQEENLAKNSTY